MTTRHVAVIDIGKTNAKLALVRLSDHAEIAVVTRPNAVLPEPPYPHFDVDGHWAFLLDGLQRFHEEFGIDAITATTHGASGALMARDGTLAAPILDYEHPGPNAVAGEYDGIRPPFAETGSPRLSGGLNLGAQIHWQLARHPELRDRVHRIVTYPQYWTHRLTGVFATDVTSLGAHSDLWNPYEGQFSSLPASLGITDKIAPPLRPGHTLGPITAEIARRTGLRADTPVYCGIHDSNASLLPHLVSRTPPYTVISTGTWVIAMAIGGKSVALDPERDTLANVNAFGDAVASARFMGGREHDIALGGAQAEPDNAQIADVLERGSMLLPALVQETGPFAGSQAAWLGPEPAQGSAHRTAAVGFYLALVTAHCLRLIGHAGPAIVEGPFARNKPFLWMLGSAAGSVIIPMDGMTGTSQGAAMLVSADGPARATDPSPSAPPDARIATRLSAYAAKWNARVLTI